MEEVWKDINLASLNDHSTRPSSSSSSSSAAFIFQDFLARPFTINTTTNSDPPPSPSPSPSPLSPAPPQSLTALSLCSHHRPINRNHHHHPHHNPFGHPPHPAAPSPPSTTKLPFSSSPLFDTIPSSSSLPCFATANRFPETSSDPAPTVDRRNKRMIKNRESAARSRARKQAYTSELQLKVDHLLEENARLKRQQQKLCEAAVLNHQQKKKRALYRTFTAPF
ncbi:protein FD [Arachis ipaensis]|uniref:protein FD n=1 Tax=Arachis ipaensis TaxID=130454 RepID=UPI0007AF8CA4|nr:protein FD [Arachis ipaensis]